jgi:hypothetical protein
MIGKILSNFTIQNKVSISQYIAAGISCLFIFFAIKNVPTLDYFYPIISVYLLVLYVFPRSWLLLLIPLTLLCDFAPYTGRFIFNEFDILLLATLAVIFMNTKIDLTFPKRKGLIFTLAFLLIYCQINWLDIAPKLLTSAYENFYYEKHYGFKIIKSLLYGFVFALIIRSQLHENKNLTRTYLFIGSLLTTIVLFIIILWEKHVFDLTLSFSGLLRTLAKILDFSGSYRVTGLMSDMHTGGEAIDGLFALIAPILLTAVFYYKKLSIKIVFILSTPLLCYCVLVGYTRSTYVAVAFSFCYICYIHYRNMQLTNRITKTFILLSISNTIFCYLLFFNIGFFALFPITLLLVFPTVHLIHKLNKFQYLLLLWLTNSISLAGLIYFHFNNQWLNPSFIGLGIIVACSGLLGVFSHKMIEYFPKENTKNEIILSYPTILITAFIIYIATSGTKISTRLDTIEVDMQSRLSHWINVINSGSWPLSKIIFGQAAGSYSKNYALSQPEILSQVGFLRINSDNFTTALQIHGGDDLKFGQRIMLEPNQNYQLSMMTKASEKTKIVWNYCERNMIVQERYNQNCSKSRQVTNNDGDWQLLTFSFNSGNVGEKSKIARWPTLLYLQIQSPSSMVSIKSISLINKNTSHELIQNNQFERGLDHWFFYNDYQHLPWHIKNTALELFYYGGIVGLFCFIVLVIIAINNSKAFDPVFGQITTAILLAWLALGLFGSPIDSAKASWFFWALLMAQSMGPIVKKTCPSS